VQFSKDVKKSKSLAELLPRLFPPTPKRERFSRFPRSVGTCPTKLFWRDQEIQAEKHWIVKLGLDQRIRFIDVQNWRLGRVRPMLAGRVPLSRLPPTSMDLKVDIL
jgi:hypothetical protein